MRWVDRLRRVISRLERFPAERKGLLADLSSARTEVGADLGAVRAQLAEFRAALSKDLSQLRGQIQQLRGSPSRPGGEGDLQQECETLRTTVRQLLDVLDFNAVPPPPPVHLQRRVVGTYSPNFVRSAVRTLQEFEGAVSTVGKSLRDFRTVLDFGVGCGRVLRRFAETYPEAQLTGADIDGEAIQWLQDNYAPQLGRFVVLPHVPPSLLEAESFDLVYAISVFTHLDEDMQFKWLEELRRVTKPGGYLLITVHGENHIQRFPPDIQSQMRAKGFYYNDKAGRTEGLPEFYKNTYHTREYVEQNWRRFFEIGLHVPKGNEDHQDLILCRKTERS